MEFEIPPYEQENIVCKLIFDLINRRIYLYKGCIDIETFKETGDIIPHGPGSLYNNRGQFQQGMFLKGQLDGLGRSIYPQYGWHQGEYSNGRYHGAGACCRGDEVKLFPITTQDYIEIGIWNQFLREGEFYLVTTEQEA